MTDDRLRKLAIALALAGLAVAGYLTWIHYAELEAVCVGGGGGCERVQASDYSELAGVPVALVGLIGYAAILASLLLRSPWMVPLTALMALGGFGFSAYLTYLELWVIDAICQWCVASALIMSGLAAVTFTRLWRGETASSRGR